MNVSISLFFFFCYTNESNLFSKNIIEKFAIDIFYSIYEQFLGDGVVVEIKMSINIRFIAIKRYFTVLIFYMHKVMLTAYPIKIFTSNSL
jgi:hypothetical protein